MSRPAQPGAPWVFGVPAHAEPDQDDRPVVLVVCTGNVCRSPVAERVLQASLDAATPLGATGIHVTSAGTGSLVGEPMAREAADVVRRHGGDPSGFVARELTPALVQEAALVLTATREHRSSAVRLVPAAVLRTFTLREAGRLARARGGEVVGGSPGERLVSLVELMVRSRGAPAAPVMADDDDVVDPYRRGPEVWAVMEAQLEPALRALGGALHPSPGA